MAEDSRRTKLYTCLVGHPIPADELATMTETHVLDHGATVVLCREHGAPISVTSIPLSPEARVVPE